MKFSWENHLIIEVLLWFRISTINGGASFTMERFPWEKNNAESLSGYEVEALSGLPPEWQEILGGVELGLWDFCMG